MSSAFGATTRKSAGHADRSQADSRGHDAQEETVGVPRFLQGSVQCRLIVGGTDDGFEREADAVANIVGRGAGEAQKAPAGASAGEPQAGSNSFSAAPSSTGPSGRIAPPMSQASTGSPIGHGEGPPTQLRSSSTAIHQHLPSVGHFAPTGIQRSTEGETGSSDALPTEGARPLSDDVRSRVEPVLGADLSGVRVHSGPAAARAAMGFEARAFTHGRDIWLGERASPDDVDLMAHEATHVVQQRAAPQGIVQRRPEDYIHPEDGSTVQSNMTTAVEDELADVDESDREDAPAPGEMPPGERSRLKGDLSDDGELPVDRAAEAQPEVQSAADQAKSEADQAAETLAEGTEKEPGAGGEDDGAGAAAGAAAEAAANALPPESPPSVEPVVPSAPHDSEGSAVAADAPADTATIALTAELQRMRVEGTDARTRASAIHGNAGILRINLRLAQSQVDAADAALSTAEGNVEARREIASQGRDALAVSEEKAAQVAAEAPTFVESAAETHEDSGPMATEAAETAGDAAGQNPDDAEAAEKMGGVSSGMAGVSSDAGTIDSAVSHTEQRAESLVEDAAEAQEKNTETADKLSAADEALNQADDRLTQLGEQNQLADTQVAALMGGPSQMDAGADELDAEASAIIDHSFGLESRLRASEEAYQSEMASIPGAKAVAAAAESADSGASGVVQRSPEDAYADRVKVDLLGAFRSPPSAAALREQEQKRLAADVRRRERIRDIERQANGDFSSLGALDRMSIALELTGENLWSGASEINWPNMAQQVILSFIDPRVSLEGVVTGLNGVLSGAANLLSGEQWERDPLGNLLKSSADIATGLTTILGSIAGLCTAILVILGALAIFTFGAMGPAFAAASAFLGPIISTVGGWALVTAAIAAELHAFVFIKNLIDAATADTAATVVSEADQMTTDATEFASAASEVVLDGVMDAGGARLANTPTGRRIGGAIEGVGRDFDMIPPPRITPDMDLPPAAALGDAPSTAGLADGPPATAAVEAPAAAPVEAPSAAAAEPSAAAASDTGGAAAVAPSAPDTGAATAAAGGSPTTTRAPDAPSPAPPPARQPAPSPRASTPDTPPAASTSTAPAGAGTTPSAGTRPASPETPPPAAAPPSPVAPEPPQSRTAPTMEAGTPASSSGEPPRPAGSDGGRGAAPERLGGATAEGVGPEFSVETMPPARIPEVEYRRPRPGAEGTAGGTAPDTSTRAMEGESPTRPADAEAAGRSPEPGRDLTPGEADLLTPSGDGAGLEPPRPTGGEGDRGSGPERLGGATAEGMGPEFNVERFPPTRMPEVEYRRPRRDGTSATAPEASGRPIEGEAQTHQVDSDAPGASPESGRDLTPEEADLLADAIDSGDFSDLPPHLRRRADIADTHADASGRSYEGEQSPADRVDVERPRGATDVPANPMDLPEIQEAALSAQAALADLPPGAGAKTVGGVEGSPSTTSGSAGSKVDTVERARELAVEAGAVREHPFDRATGGPGYYHGSHAEVQTITNHPGRPVAVSKPMCGGCQDFFRRHAEATGQRLIVADPEGIRVFLEDGSVHMTPHGELRASDMSTSPLPDPPAGAPIGRSR